MKTTKRSKMLLSSIAMLLVALVALGSATYAWYSINRSVTADGISVQASAVGGLQIASPDVNSGSYANSISFSDAAVVLDPATISVAAGGAVSAQTGTHESGVNVVGSPSLAGATNGDNTYYVSHVIKVKNTDKTAISATPTITWASTPSTSFFVAALYDKTAGTVILETSSAGARVSGQTAYTTSASAVSFTQNVEHEYVFVVYADGWNENCTATNGNANSTSDIGVSITWE